MFLAPILVLRLYFRARKNRKYLERWPERFGRYRGEVPNTRPIWIHAVSVGESMAAIPLVRALNEKFKGVEILITTTTPAGAETVDRLLGDVASHVYFPYDIPFALNRFFERFRPFFLIIIETELWPNTIEFCVQRAVPVLLANARLSERSLRAYSWVRVLSREIVRSIDFIGAQTLMDRDRFISLGADPANIDVMGSLKFDLPVPASMHEQAEVLRRDLGINRPMLMAGSTRTGEERIVLTAFERIKKETPGALLIIAPRHPDRFGDVAELCREFKFSVVRHSHRISCTSEVDVYLVDTVGELPQFYAASDVAFVGGSLLPFGGHNVLEPASMGTPVLVGPHTYNFAEICLLLEQAGALRVVENGRNLVDVVLNWLADSNGRDRAGRIGREIVRRHRGATERTVVVVEELIKETEMLMSA